MQLLMNVKKITVIYEIITWYQSRPEYKTVHRSRRPKEPFLLIGVVFIQDNITRKCALVEHIFSLDQIFRIPNFLFRARMTTETKIHEKLEGDENFRSYRYRVSLLLE
jgi:hypothetical protein